MLRPLIVACVVVLAGFGNAAPVSAQALIWSVPDDEAALVRFEGTYKCKQSQPEASEGDLELEWRYELTIKSVGKQMADVKGKQVPCRWIEIKSVTGKPSELGIQPGPFGTRIYKLLVPEKGVIGRVADRDNIPVTFLEIVKGYRKIGEREVTPIVQKVLEVDPMLALVAYYPNLKAEGAPEELTVPLGAVPAQKYAGTEQLETDTTRAIQEGALWVSKDTPFGMTRLQAKVILQEKDLAAAKEDFKQVAEITVEISAVEKRTDAKSDLPESE